MLTWFVLIKYTWNVVRPPTNHVARNAYAMRNADAGDFCNALQTVRGGSPSINFFMHKAHIANTKKHSNVVEKTNMKKNG